MSKEIKIAIVLLGLVIVLLCIAVGNQAINSYDSALKMSKNIPAGTATAVPSTMTSSPTVFVPTQTPEMVYVTQTPVPSLVPNTKTPVSLMNNYVYKGIDLSSGLPTSLSFVMPDGKVITSPWNFAIAYKNGDVESVVFGPAANTIYTHFRDVVITWLHSGTYEGRTIFATDLEMFVRLNDAGQTLSLDESQARVASLKTAKIYLCQLDSQNINGEMCLPDQNNPHMKVVELMMVSGVVIPHEKVEEYEANAEHTKEWLEKNYPGSGFELLNTGDSWLIKTCVGILNGQRGDGTKPFLFNRLAIGFIAM